MAFIYCQSCGNKNTYSTSVPNFCSKCGSPMSSANHTPNPTAHQREPSSEPSSEPSNEASASASWRNLSSLNCDVKTYYENTPTFDQVLGSGSIGGSIQRSGYKTRHGSASKDILKSCQSSKPQDIDDPKRAT